MKKCNDCDERNDRNAQRLRFWSDGPGPSNCDWCCGWCEKGVVSLIRSWHDGDEMCDEWANHDGDEIYDEWGNGMKSKPYSELIFRLGRTGSFTILSGSLGELVSLVMCRGPSVGTTLPLPLPVTMTLSLIIRINPIRDLSEWRWTILIISRCPFNFNEWLTFQDSFSRYDSGPLP